MHQQVQQSTTVRSAHTVFMCFVFIWEQTATCATWTIKWLVFVTEMKSVYSAVRTGSLNEEVCASSLLNYLLIPLCRVLLEKLTGLQLVKKFPAFHGTRRLITALTSARQLSLSWASPIQSIYPQPTSWRFIIILSTHLRLGLPSGLFHSGFPTKTLYTPLSSPIHATCPAHLILLDFITALYWVRSTNHLAPRYAISSIPPLPRPS